MIIKEAAHLARVANHWCEPYCFLQDRDQVLIGHTRVSLPGYTAPNGSYVSVDPGDDMFMMAQEIETLLRGLSCWSKAYKLGWQLEFDGSPVGSVDASGNYSSALRAFIVELHSAAATPTDPEDVKGKLAALRFQHASRSGGA